MRVASIFSSIDGEVCSNTPDRRTGAGMFTVFLRLTGCNLRCWGGKCDTQYSFKGGKNLTVNKVEKKLESFYKDIKGKDFFKRLTITGGEPLLQLQEVIKLIEKLVRKRWLINIETNGSIDVRDVKSNLSIAGRIFTFFTVDYKLPSTGMEVKLHYDNYRTLSVNDWIKFVIEDEEDYEKAITIVELFDIKRPRITFSNKYGAIEPKTIIEWIKRDYKKHSFLLNVTMQTQLHKIFWPELACTAKIGKEV